MPVLTPISAIIFQTKSNCVNTINKFYNEDVENVKRLDFSPDIMNRSTILEKEKKCTDCNEEVRAKRRQIILSTSTAGKKDKNVLPDLLQIQQPDISNKKDYLHKLENLNKEKKLGFSLKTLNERLKVLKKEKKNVVNLMETLLKELDNHKITTEVLENLGKMAEMSEIQKYERLKRSPKKQNTQDRNKIFCMLSNLQREHEGRMNSKRDIIALSEAQKDALDKLNFKYEEMHKEYVQIKGDITHVKNQLMIHYHSLLYEGLDCRQEGLVWIIKAIWALEEEVMISFMPNFLDELAVDYLFSIAHKDFEIGKIKEQIDQARTSLQNSFMNKRKKSIIIFRTDLQKWDERRNSEIRKRNLFKDYKAQFEDEPGKLKLQNVEEYLSKNEHFDEMTLQMLDAMKNAEKKYELLKREVVFMRKKEILRINREFLENDYERRYNVAQEVVVAALVGEQNKHSELLRQMQEKKNILDKLKSVRYYNGCETKIKKVLDKENPQSLFQLFGMQPPQVNEKD